MKKILFSYYRLRGVKGSVDMPMDARKSDLRIIKTEKVLNAAMYTLLERNSFGRITVRDICEEAQISRATFYARFADKYDFLKSWLINLKPEGMELDENYEKTKKLCNNFFRKNKTVIRNLICDADDVTIGVLSEFALSFFDLLDEYDFKRMNPSQIVFYIFCTGGLIYYFQWIAKNKFPSEVDPVNTYLLQIIRQFKEWARGAE